eukprot:6895854-Alexandrium_andersonii.AAC.1
MLRPAPGTVSPSCPILGRPCLTPSRPGSRRPGRSGQRAKRVGGAARTLGPRLHGPRLEEGDAVVEALRLHADVD